MRPPRKEGGGRAAPEDYRPRCACKRARHSASPARLHTETSSHVRHTPEKEACHTAGRRRRQPAHGRHACSLHGPHSRKRAHASTTAALPYQGRAEGRSPAAARDTLWYTPSSSTLVAPWAPRHAGERPAPPGSARRARARGAARRQVRAADGHDGVALLRVAVAAHLRGRAASAGPPSGANSLLYSCPARAWE